MVRLRMLTLLSLGLLLVASSASSQETIVTTREVTFKWTEASGEVDFYAVLVERSGERIPHLDFRTADDIPRATIAGTVGEWIRISVIAGNNEGAWGPQSPWSEPVRFDVPDDVLLQGVFRAHGSGSTPGDLFYDEPETGDVWLVKGDDPDAEPLHIGNEAPESDWEAVATGDFDGDGVTDLFWLNSADGATRIWFMDMDGALDVELDTHLAPGVDWPEANWTPLMAGDFDGNGRDDLFWRSDSGQTLAWMFEYHWYYRRSHCSSQYFPSVNSEDWQLLATGNFDGDTDGKDDDGDANGKGKDELFWRDTREGKTALWFCEFEFDDEERVLDYVQYERSNDLGTEWDVVEVVGSDEDYPEEGLLMRSNQSPDEEFEWWR